jgi:hypothetical protein
VPAGVEIVQGQSNRVPEPTADDYVIFTPLTEHRLSTNVDEYDAISSVSRMESVQLSYQLDIHGPNSQDNARVIKLLWRSDYAVDATDDAVLQPLYASDGAQRPFINGEGQYENRWVLTVEAQIRPAVSTAMQFADTVAVEFFPVAGA